MPFTPAHVVAAVPLARWLGRHASVSALAIGAMTPDLAYFLPVDVARYESHSLPGLVWFCLPVGLATWAFFHLLVAPLAHDVAPDLVRDRLPLGWPAGRLPAVRIESVAFCILLGAITHLVWDSFTHWGTPLTRTFPILARSIGEVGGFRVYPVRIAQHASTALGFVVLAVWGRRWLARPAVAAPTHAASPLLRAALAVAVVAPPLWLGLDAGLAHAAWLDEPVRSLVRFTARLVYVGGSTFGATLALVAGTWRLVRPSLLRETGDHVER